MSYKSTKPKPRRRYRRKRTTQISLDIPTFDMLWADKERFRQLVGGKMTWDGFLEQSALFLEANCLLPSVKATRYNPYVYGADCPKCGFEEYPLRRRRKVIWRVKCRKCGEEYIALA